ncbi:NAD(P)/FAD-dependent oxidoreductase [Sphaerobacter thermophilus]|uniref:FAD dependent oxidoreductase n=1 Tax=Sphaerobacter thermophilus (strain ATCC 49802 / DSM 20745 / KCCM 41009 / NCIMB 13125 / S 6022) TaxID=479434 RepID=D1CA57_SPHTD|nr:FAD-dependent oxidoreductase [Sphaerobacter thermophilus]ACZ40700.1 FAD dependent oxidoreductase [Sphaerobacter thermophilus DSM 20745]
MKNYASYSFWLETCGDDLTPRAPLDGSIDVDVAILGAGYTGLWTAYYLLRRQPSLRVAVVEAEIAGFGASGRNGGWCSAGFPVTAGELARRYGPERTRALLAAMRESVDEVGRVAEAEGLDIDYVKGGTLRVARGPHQEPMLDQALATYERLGIADHYTRLDAAQVAERVRITDVRGALYSPDCAVIHPGKLVRGLARVVERLGGTIYEQTRVTAFEPRQAGVPGSRPRLITERGDVRAEVVVLCGEAYLSRLPGLRRQLIPVYSLIVLTEPLSDAQWAEIGWENRETIGSHRFSVDYLSRTRDGRIVFGGRGAPYHFGSRIEDSYDRHEPTHQMLRRMTLEWFPMLRGIRFTHHWGGPLGMPRDWMPTMSYDRATGIATARGYTGQGVATSNLSGRVLADLICDTPSPLRVLPVIGHRSPDWEPEPLRWLGVRYVQRGFARLDEQAERTGRPPSGRSLVERLGRH